MNKKWRVKSEQKGKEVGAQVYKVNFLHGLNWKINKDKDEILLVKNYGGPWHNVALPLLVAN